LKTDFYHLSHIARQASLKKARLLQSSSPYQSIKLSNIGKISSNNTQQPNNIVENKLNNDSIIQFITATIDFIENNWWIILGVVIYLYLMFIIVKRRS